MTTATVTMTAEQTALYDAGDSPAAEADEPSIDNVRRALQCVADFRPRGDGIVWVDAAPASEDYDGDTSPGSSWDEECDDLLASVRAELPDGWVAEWNDNDICVTRGES